MTKKEILQTSTKDLLQQRSSLENEEQAIQGIIINIDTEIFYRMNPECRPT